MTSRQGHFSAARDLQIISTTACFLFLPILTYAFWQHHQVFGEVVTAFLAMYDRQSTFISGCSCSGLARLEGRDF